MTVLVDTGVLFAAAAVRDARHARAAEIVRELEGQRAFITDHVLIESWALMNLRFGYAVAGRFWSSLRETPLAIEPVTLVDLERAHAIAEAWSDQEFDIVDCTSFAVAERLGCRRAASFDTDFAIYRFGPARREAFEILR